MTASEIHVHVHLDGPADQVSVYVTVGAEDLTELKEALMATKDEVLASLTAVRETLVELGTDVARLVDLFNEAVANGDLTAIAALAAELGTISTAIDAAVEAAAPEAEQEPPVEG